MKVNILEATASQLAEYATVHLGLPGIRHTMGKDKILALMAQTGFNQPTIDVDADTASAAKSAAAPAASGEAEPERIRIIIPNQDGPGGDEPVVVGVNGDVARIQRGVPVMLQKKHVLALQNATKMVYKRGPNGEPIDPTPVPVHPFSILAA